jgi:hypothetical protein
MVLVVLFAALVVLTQGLALPIYDPGFDVPQDKWPDGGFELAVRPKALDDVGCEGYGSA